MVIDHSSDIPELVTLDPIPLEAADLDFLRDLANRHNIQYFNTRFAKGHATSFSILKKISKMSNLGIGKGFSISCFSKGGYGFAVGHEFSKQVIKDTFEKAAKLAKWSSQFTSKDYSIMPTDTGSYSFQIPQKISLDTIDPSDKLSKLLEIESEVYYNPNIVSSSVNYSDSEYEKLIYNSSGRSVRVKESGIFFIIQAIAKREHRQEGYNVSHGGLGGFEILDQAYGKGREAAENALALLNSFPAPSGVHDLIMDPTLTGTFVHEAFGHAAEADSILSGESILAGKIGTKVGPSDISIVDDPSFKTGFGYNQFDDEGTRGKKTYIVKEGFLTGYLHNLETASRMEEEPTGNGRAGSFSTKPQVRMSNTFICPGDSSVEEMIEEMKNGLIGIGWKYGYTDPIDGTFQFKLAKAYLVEHGEKKHLIHDVAISGITLNVLSRIGMIGKDVEYDAGHCGKGGQSIAVGSGGPHLLIRDMVIGGQ